MKELNEKLIISIAVGFLVIGIGFNLLFPSQKSIFAEAPSMIKPYKPIEIRQAAAFNSEWPEAKEQAKGEMYDLFTPPEIFLSENGDFVFRPPYAVAPKGPFGINLLSINKDLYRFQLEGFIERNKDDQSQTIILVHSVEDGKILRLSPNAIDSEKQFEILDWKIDRRFEEDDQSTEVVASLKLKDNAAERIVNLKHYNSFYEDSLDVRFKALKNNEEHIITRLGASFYVDDIEFRLDSVDLDKNTALVTKLIPDSEPRTEVLYISKSSEESNNTNTISNSEIEKTIKSESIEDAFNSFF